MVQLDSASESALSQQAELRGDEFVELWTEDISAKPMWDVHSWWGRYLFWHEMHDDVKSVMEWICQIWEPVKVMLCRL